MGERKIRTIKEGLDGKKEIKIGVLQMMRECVWVVYRKWGNFVYQTNTIKLLEVPPILNPLELSPFLSESK